MNKLLGGLLLLMSPFLFAQESLKLGEIVKYTNAYKYADIYSKAKHLAGWSNPENKNYHIVKSYEELVAGNENAVKSYCMHLGGLYELVASVRSDSFSTKSVSTDSDRMVRLLIPIFAYCGDTEEYDVKVPRVDEVIVSLNQISEIARKILATNEVSSLLSH